MLDNNSYFELQHNLFPSNSATSNSTTGSTAPQYLFPRMGPVIEIDPNYVALRRALWSKRAIAGLEDCREIPDFSLQAIINSHWKLQGVVHWVTWVVQTPVLVSPMELITSNYDGLLSRRTLQVRVVDLGLVNESGKNLEFIRVKSLYGAASSASVVMSKSCNISMGGFNIHSFSMSKRKTSQSDWSSESSEEEQAPSIHLSSSKGHHQSSGNISPPSIGNYNDGLHGGQETPPHQPTQMLQQEGTYQTNF
ncbi:uncharacterized protein G2W53_037419 [Senna tora]|uniref:Uncharacterized protein n=1 Tax=Senna tora TaxID=362788 RepID=A0A834SXA7_9FABA|nr:uncharacterized protein G2W53_037419 [Senna tora]